MTNKGKAAFAIRLRGQNDRLKVARPNEICRQPYRLALNHKRVLPLPGHEAYNRRQAIAEIPFLRPLTPSPLLLKG